MRLKLDKQHHESWIVTHITVWHVGVMSKNLIQVFTLENKTGHSRTWTQYREYLSQFSYYRDKHGSLHVHQTGNIEYCEDIKHKFIECDVGDTILGISLHSLDIVPAYDMPPGGKINYDKSRPRIDEAELEIQL